MAFPETCNTWRTANLRVADSQRFSRPTVRSFLVFQRLAEKRENLLLSSDTIIVR